MTAYLMLYKNFCIFNIIKISLFWTIKNNITTHFLTFYAQLMVSDLEK
jgi:hypothetical protein